jgi:hypothetical protein
MRIGIVGISSTVNIASTHRAALDTISHAVEFRSRSPRRIVEPARRPLT